MRTAGWMRGWRVGLVVALAVWTAGAALADGTAVKLPRLLDLGAKACIPCKLMAPILDELRQDYGDRFVTEFVDVWEKENVARAKEHGIKGIPTQIFFDAEGRELWRHQGFLSKEDILAKWAELGVAVDRAPAALAAGSAADKGVEPRAPAQP